MFSGEISLHSVTDKPLTELVVADLALSRHHRRAVGEELAIGLKEPRVEWTREYDELQTGWIRRKLSGVMINLKQPYSMFFSQVWLGAHFGLAATR